MVEKDREYKYSRTFHIKCGRATESYSKVVTWPNLSSVNSRH